MKANLERLKRLGVEAVEAELRRVPLTSAS